MRRPALLVYRRRQRPRLAGGAPQPHPAAAGAVVIADALARLLGVGQWQATARRAWLGRRLGSVIATAAVPAGRRI